MYIINYGAMTDNTRENTNYNVWTLLKRIIVNLKKLWKQHFKNRSERKLESCRVCSNNICLKWNRIHIEQISIDNQETIRLLCFPLTINCSTNICTFIKNLHCSVFTLSTDQSINQSISQITVCLWWEDTFCPETLESNQKNDRLHIIFYILFVIPSFNNTDNDHNI